jgi:hypothetical protein
MKAIFLLVGTPVQCRILLYKSDLLLDQWIEYSESCTSSQDFIKVSVFVRSTDCIRNRLHSVHDYSFRSSLILSSNLYLDLPINFS